MPPPPAPTFFKKLATTTRHFFDYFSPFTEIQALPMIPNVLLFCISSETFEEEKRKSELHLLFCKSPSARKKIHTARAGLTYKKCRIKSSRQME
jgi:hypothetical protein